MTPSRRRVYRFGDFRLNPVEQVLVHRDRRVALTPKAFETLVALVERHGHLVPKEELFRIVWPDAFVEENNLAQNISTLRRVLAGGSAGRQFIETIPKRGYRFTAVVVEEEEGEVEGEAADGDRPVDVATRRRAAMWVLTAVLLAAAALAAHSFSRARSPAVSTDRAGRIGGSLDGAARRTAGAGATRDSEAHLAYLRGMAAFQQAASDTSLQAQARRDLEDAVARDPGFALAWSWLSRVYGTQYRTGAERTADTKRAAYRAAQTAIDLDRELPEGHIAMAEALRIDRAYAGALRELELARAAAPDSPDLLQIIGRVEQSMGQWDRSLNAYLRAFEFDPASTADLIAVHYLHLRQYDEAARYIDIAKAANRAAAVVPDAWMRFSATGDVADARRGLETALGTRSPPDARVLGFLARLEWIDGRHERALELIARMDGSGAWLPANFRFPASLAAGQVYESMGNRRGADRSYAAAVAMLQDRLRTAGDDYQVHAALGLAMAGLGRASEAVHHATRAIELLPTSADAVLGPVCVYLLAQIHARLGSHVAAFATLDEYFSLPGFYSEQWIRRDPWFATLWSRPKFDDYRRRWSARRGDVLLHDRALPARGGR
jgi:DNA-binding winged helix-turn-helix (wHTH) protein/tetratricopeptide (TPR) repeat protein